MTFFSLNENCGTNLMTHQLLPCTSFIINKSYVLPFNVIKNDSFENLSLMRYENKKKEERRKEVLLVRRFENSWWNSFRSCLLFVGPN